MATYGIGATAQNLLNQPYGGVSPFAPAGMTDAQRQGQTTTLQGMGSQFAPSQQYAQQMQGLLGQSAGSFGQGMQSGAFGWNPQMQGAYNMAGASAQPNALQGAGALSTVAGMNPQLYNNAQQGFANATNQPGFGQGGNMLNNASGIAANSMNQPGFGLAANAVGSTLGSYGGGYSTGMADTINTTGSSFDPYKNPALLQSVSAANRALGRDFNQSVMPAMNKGAIGAGSGGYGGARAGVAQGIREQGLADAMSRQTSDMMSSGYEAGLNRYVQDRGQTVNATLEALKQGGYLGMQGANTLGNIANMQGNLGQTAASNIGNFGSAMGNLANQQGNLGLGAAQGQAGIANSQSGNFLQGGNQLGNMGNQQAANMYNAAGLQGQLGQNSLGQNNSMYQFGYGQMLPNAVNNAYQAGLQPGNIMQNIGGQMSGYGQQQQMYNQSVADWQNQAFNHAQAYPQQQFANYAANVSPLTSQAGQQPQGPVQSSPLQGAVQGGTLGYGLANAWQQGQQGSSVPQQNAATWGTVPGSQQSQMLAQQWS